MRQAVLRFRDETAAEWGLEPIQDAGLRDAEILTCEGARGVVLVHLEEPIDEEAMDGSEVVEWWEPIERTNGEYVYVLEIDDRASDDDGSMDMKRLPTEDVRITDRGFELRYVAPQRQIRDLVEEFEAAGTEVTLRELRGYRIEDGPLDTLTERQREVLETAHEQGYYDLPRQGSMAEIATELGLDDSTVAEHLQRAERNILTTLLGSPA